MPYINNPYDPIADSDKYNQWIQDHGGQNSYYQPDGTEGPSPTPTVPGVQGDPSTGFTERGGPMAGQPTASNAVDPYAQYQNQIQKFLSSYNSRQAPTSAFTPTGPAAQAQGVTLGPAAQSQATLAGPAAQAQATLAGPAAQSAGSSQFTNYMTGSADYLGKLMRGEDSVAAIQAKQAANQLLGQQASLAAGASPASSVAAQRIAGQNMAQMGGTLEANQLAAQLAERSAATNALSQLSTAGRAQDFGNQQFNAGETNQTARVNAGLGTQTNIANAGETNQTERYNAGLGTQVGMANTGAKNDFLKSQAGMDLQNNQYNAGSTNDLTKFNAGANLQNNQFNVNAKQTQDLANQNATRDLLGQSFNYNKLNADNANKDKDLAFQFAQLDKQYPGLLEKFLASGGSLAALAVQMGRNGGGGGGGNIGSGLGDNFGDGSSSWNGYPTDSDLFGPGSPP